jgi:hypothetical protein
MEDAMRRYRRTSTSRPALSFDRVQHTMTVGRRSVAMASGPDDNEAILRAFLQLVAEQRGVPMAQGLVLRRRDIAVLADFLDLDDEALEGKLASILKLTEREAVDLRGQLLRHRVAAAAVGVGMLAGVPAGTAPSAAADAAVSRPVGAVAEETFAIMAPVRTPISIDAMARMDAIVSATPPVVVPAGEWTRRRRSKPSTAAAVPAAAVEPPAVVAPEPAPEVASAPATEPTTEIGDAATYERDLDLELPPGVEIGSALVLER